MRGGGCDGENGFVGGEYGLWWGCSVFVGMGMYGKDESEEGGLKNENRRVKNWMFVVCRWDGYMSKVVVVELYVV